MRKNPLRALTKRRDFELVFKEGANVASKYLVMYARPNELSISRLGLSVSKKIGKAVTRNRVKRLLRESMRKLLEGLPLNYDFVLVARKSSAGRELDEFVHEIRTFLPKISHGKNSDITHNAI
jgi:ribonuclease P protein component